MNNMLLMLVLVDFFIGCNHNGPRPYVPVDPKVKALFNYQVGSYWIMQDSLSGEVDSFAVVTNAETVHEAGDYNDEQHYVQVREFHAAATRYAVDYTLFRGCTVRFHVLIGLQNNIYHYDTVYSFNEFPIQVDNLSGTDLTQNGTTYHDVLSKQVLGASLTSALDTLSVSLNKDYGFIHIEASTDSYRRNWKLVRSKVIY